MRLIDADNLAKSLRTNALSCANSDEKYSLVKSELLNEIAEIIDCEEVTPTVYSVDKVMEQLEKALRMDWEKCYMVPDEVIDIVKGGGKGE